MKYMAIDTETFLIGPGVIAPRLVCLSVAYRDEKGDLCRGLYNAKDGVLVASEILDRVINREVVLCLQNGVFDFGVLIGEEPSLLSKVFEVYDAGGVVDCKERQKLIDLADGNMKFAIDENGDFVRSMYSLDALAFRHLGWRLDKSSDGWRLRYAELVDVPLDDWPADAKEYAVRDAAATLLVVEAQDRTQSPVVKPCMFAPAMSTVTDEDRQLRAAWALHLHSMWGVRTDPDSVKALKQSLLKEREEVHQKLSRTSFYRSHTFQRGEKAGQTKISRNMKELRKAILSGFKRRGLPLPLTDSGQKLLSQRQCQVEDLSDEELLSYIKTDGEALEDASEASPLGEDDPLRVYSRGQYGERLLTRYVPALEAGVRIPLRASYNLLLETGRTSCREDGEGLFSPQVQPRKEGVRECFVPRPGYVFCFVDYEQIELCAWAQVLFWLFGDNELRNAINDGLDIHALTGSTYLGIAYEEFVRRRVAFKAGEHEGSCSKGCQHPRMSHANLKDRCTSPGCSCSKFLDMFSEADSVRQAMKGPNYGFPGGMGEVKFVDYMRKSHGKKITREEAARMRRAWRETLPIHQKYFDWVSAQVGEGSGSLLQFKSGRIRGGVSFTQMANGTFQGLVADGAKEALWEVARACYDYESNPLFGSRPWGFAHDEIMSEMPEESAHEAAHEKARIMKSVMKRWIPDVHVGAEPALARRWAKGAATVYDASGRLIPWGD